MQARIYERGYIYKGAYEGWYCMSDEAFLTDDQVVDIVDASGRMIKVCECLMY
jgi:methionyl-tRNA synthetase